MHTSPGPLPWDLITAGEIVQADRRMGSLLADPDLASETRAHLLLFGVANRLLADDYVQARRMLRVAQVIPAAALEPLSATLSAVLAGLPGADPGAWGHVPADLDVALDLTATLTDGEVEGERWAAVLLCEVARAHGRHDDAVIVADRVSPYLTPPDDAWVSRIRRLARLSGPESYLRG